MSRLETECSICLEQITEDTNFTTICNHNFHKNCLGKWCNTNKTCPSCREPLIAIKPICIGKFKNGNPCTKRSAPGSKFCAAHIPPFVIINGRKLYSEGELVEYLEHRYSLVSIPRGFRSIFM